MAKDTVFSTKKTLNINGNLLELNHPMVMGILNVTPDSFFDGGRYQHQTQILQQCEKMLSDGAEIIDVGGYSSRPGAEEITEKDEIQRIKEAISVIKKYFPDALLSVDTFRANVAKVAVAEGASIVNDISGGTLDSGMFETVAALNVPYILMHMRGNPGNMQTKTSYDNLLMNMVDYFIDRLNVLKSWGLNDVIIDPGFGFAKTVEQNYEILKNLSYFQVLKLPILVGLSRKSMIHKLLEITPDTALNGTTALNTMALMNGAKILRVHDVKEAVEIVRLFKATVN